MHPAFRIHVNQFEWESANTYPEALQKVVHWKMLVGGAPPAIQQTDVLMGVLDLEAGGYYPLHFHPAPEIYFILSGTAEWTVGDETFTAEPGMAIYHASNGPHRMVNRGTVPLKSIWFWWAPNGERSVLQVGVELLEDMPNSQSVDRQP